LRAAGKVDRKLANTADWSATSTVLTTAVSTAAVYVTNEPAVVHLYRYFSRKVRDSEGNLTLHLVARLAFEAVFRARLDSTSTCVHTIGGFAAAEPTDFVFSAFR
jgi:hypothetical protein